MSATEKGGVNFPVNSGDEAVSGWAEETACYAANWDDEDFSSKSMELISPL